MRVLSSKLNRGKMRRCTENYLSLPLCWKRRWFGRKLSLNRSRSCCGTGREQRKALW